MGTKNNPGEFDCYKNAEPNEPMFVLLARDWDAPCLVEKWALQREALDGRTDKVREARECAIAMRRWYDEREERDAVEGVQAAVAPPVASAYNAIDDTRRLVKDLYGGNFDHPALDYLDAAMVAMLDADRARVFAPQTESTKEANDAR